MHTCLCQRGKFTIKWALIKKKHLKYSILFTCLCQRGKFTIKWALIKKKYLKCKILFKMKGLAEYATLIYLLPCPIIHSRTLGMYHVGNLPQAPGTALHTVVSSQFTVLSPTMIWSTKTQDPNWTVFWCSDDVWTIVKALTHKKIH